MEITATTLTTIYNSAGQAVCILVAEYQCAGHYAVEWDATDGHGQQVSAGMYFYHLQAGEAFSTTKKMMLLK